MLSNPLTLVVMKLVAMRNRWLASQDEAKSAGKRADEASEARKQAADVWRTLAMVTREENDFAREVIEGIRHGQDCNHASEIFAEYSAPSDAWALRAVSGAWQEEHQRIRQNILAEWLRQGAQPPPRVGAWMMVGPGSGRRRELFWRPIL